MSRLERAVSIDDLRELSRKRLPRAVFEFIDGGSGDEVTLRANKQALADLTLMPRMGMNVGVRSTATQILGRPVRLPLVLAPTGLAGLFWPEGELAAATAAREAGVPFCLSTNSVASIEEVAAATQDTDRWFQLYMLKDERLMAELLDRAAAAGYGTLCLTVDLPVQGRRERDLRNGFAVPFKPRLANLVDLALHPRWLLGVWRSPVRFGNFETDRPASALSIAEHVSNLFNPAADWDDISAIRRSWRGSFVVKGILHPDDARMALDIGADAVVVSNHGGRQLDGVPAAAAALPAVVDAIASRAEVILDGGVRRGTDILKALALGASACTIGRAFLWGLAAGGGPGVSKSLAILRDELDTSMALLGVSRLQEVGADHLAPNPNVPTGAVSRPSL